eukprot:4587365-Pyramimonas_sp.AAC.1
MAESRGAIGPPRRKRPRSRTRPTLATSRDDQRELTMPKPSGDASDAATSLFHGSHQSLRINTN